MDARPSAPDGPAGAVGEQELGGGVTAVTRVGGAVHRAQGPWSPSVHVLLGHLREGGFDAAPQFLGIDEDGREILTFVDGDTLPDDGPVPDQILLDAARLLRAYHDATADLAARGLDGLQFPPVRPVEVVCHNDFAPYNLVVRDGRAVGVIDFDTAGLGPRAWDLAYALYRFAPLRDGMGTPAAQARRVRAFLDAYDATPTDRVAAVRLVGERLGALVAFMEAQAQAGNAAYAEHLARGDAELYRRDIAYASRWLATGRRPWPAGLTLPVTSGAVHHSRT